MDFKDDSFTSFMREQLLKILTALEKDGIHQPWKLIRKSDSFTLIVNFPAKGGNKGKRKPIKEQASGLNFACQHKDKKTQDSSGVRLAEQSSAKSLISDSMSDKGRKLSAENTVAHYIQLQETWTVPVHRFLWIVSQRILGAWNVHSMFQSCKHGTQ